MSFMGFDELPTIDKPDIYLDIAFKRARTQARKRHFWRERNRRRL